MPPARLYKWGRGLPPYRHLLQTASPPLQAWRGAQSPGIFRPLPSKRVPVVERVEGAAPAAVPTTKTPCLGLSADEMPPGRTLARMLLLLTRSGCATFFRALNPPMWWFRTYTADLVLP